MYIRKVVGVLINSDVRILHTFGIVRFDKEVAGDR